MTMDSNISSARLHRIFRSVRRAPVAVVGDWMLDRYVWGNAARLSPEAAVPVVDFVQQSECLGGAGNVAANLSALGAHVMPFGVTGADEPGSALRVAARQMGLPVRGLVLDPARPTTVKTRIIARHQQVVRVDREVRLPLAPKVEEALVRRILSSLAAVKALVLSDYDKGVVTDSLAERVLGACRKLGVPAFVKPKWSRLPLYPGATAIVCNRAEAGFLVTRALDSDESVEDAGRALLAHFACAAVIITRGAQGMSAIEQEVPALHIPATSQERHFGQTGRDQNRGGRQVFDVTGAGDTVLSTVALTAAAGATLQEAAMLGNAAAGVVVGKLGTATVSHEELRTAARELL
jgi:rfaE bifunctional protein kinase chain/domain